MFAQIPILRALPGEAWAAIAGVLGSALLLAKKLLGHKASEKHEPISRADFYAEMLAVRERINGMHLALLDKLDANQREVLGAIERQVSRINMLESGVARLDERTEHRPWKRL